MLYEVPVKIYQGLILPLTYGVEYPWFNVQAQAPSEIWFGAERGKS